LVEMHLDLQKM